MPPDFRHAAITSFPSSTARHRDPKSIPGGGQYGDTTCGFFVRNAAGVVSIHLSPYVAGTPTCYRDFAWKGAGADPGGIAPGLAGLPALRGAHVARTAVAPHGTARRAPAHATRPGSIRHSAWPPSPARPASAARRSASTCAGYQRKSPPGSPGVASFCSHS